MPQLSTAIQALKASSTVAFNTKAKDLARTGVDVVAMTAGEPDFQPPEHVLEAAHEAIRKGMTKYHPGRRHPGTARGGLCKVQAGERARVQPQSNQRFDRRQASPLQRLHVGAESRRRGHCSCALLGVVPGAGAARGRRHGAGHGPGPRTVSCRASKRCGQP